LNPEAKDEGSLNYDSYTKPVTGYSPDYDWTLKVQEIELEKGCFNYFAYIAWKS